MDVKEVLGNRTAGVTFLLLRAIWEMRGVASWEHPLSSMMLRLRCCHALLGLPHVHKTRIDQCAFNLCPGDCRYMRYLKPTAIVTVGCEHFPERRCNGQHEHIQLLGSYRSVRNGVASTVRRSHEAGVYSKPLCRALAALHGR